MARFDQGAPLVIVDAERADVINSVKRAVLRDLSTLIEQKVDEALAGRGNAAATKRKAISIKPNHGRGALMKFTGDAGGSRRAKTMRSECRPMKGEGAPAETACALHVFRLYLPLPRLVVVEGAVRGTPIAHPAAAPGPRSLTPQPPRRELWNSATMGWLPGDASHCSRVNQSLQLQLPAVFKIGATYAPGAPPAFPVEMDSRADRPLLRPTSSCLTTPCYCATETCLGSLRGATNAEAV